MTHPAVPALAQPTLAEVLRRGAALQPDQPAIVSENGSITYGGLDRRASQVAHGLGALGVGRQERVVFLARNRIEYFELLFGGAKAGIVTVPVNWRLAPAEVDAVIEDAAPSILVVERDYMALAERAISMLGRDRVVVLEQDMSPEWEDLLSAQPTDDPMVDVSPDEVMFQLYTSGTTGVPKGVMLSHANLIGSLEGLADAWCFDPGCIVYVPYPAFHAVGNGWVILTLGRGGTALLRRAVDPKDFIESVERSGVTNTMMVPSVLQSVLATPGIETADLSSLRYIVYGAAPIPDVVLDRAP